MWKEILHFFQFFRLAVCLPKEITRIFILTQNHATTRSLRGTLSAKGTKLEVKQVQRGGPLGALVLVQSPHTSTVLQYDHLELSKSKSV